MRGCRISATSSIRIVAEFLRHPMFEWLNKFCDIQRIRLYRLSAKSSEWEVAEFLRNLANERLQNFCDVRYTNGCGVIATCSQRMVAEFLATSIDREVAEFLRYPFYQRSKNCWDLISLTRASREKPLIYLKICYFRKYKIVWKALLNERSKNCWDLIVLQENSVVNAALF